MDVYATVEDLEAGWKSLDDIDIDEETAETLLTRASAYLATFLGNRGIVIDLDNEIQKTNLCSVTCSIVRRSLNEPNADGIASIAQSIGSTNVSVNYRAQDGSFYLSEADKELLGIKSRGKYRSMRAAIHNADGTLVEGW